MGTSCTQLHMFYVANKSRESETSTYYNLHAFVCHFIFQSATNNTISSNILQYIAICNISIFSIGHIVLYCSSKYCNIAIFRYIVSPLVHSYMHTCMHVYTYIHSYVLFATVISFRIEAVNGQIGEVINYGSTIKASI